MRIIVKRIYYYYCPSMPPLTSPDQLYPTTADVPSGCDRETGTPAASHTVSSQI